MSVSIEVDAQNNLKKLKTQCEKYSTLQSQASTSQGELEDLQSDIEYILDRLNDFLLDCEFLVNGDQLKEEYEDGIKTTLSRHNILSLWKLPDSNPTTALQLRDEQPFASGDDYSNNPMEAQAQELLIDQQDKTLSHIESSIGILRQQAKVMGQEMVDQNMILEDIEAQADQTSSSLAKAQRRIDNFISANRDSPSSWFILILIMILTVLLIMILFF